MRGELCWSGALGHQRDARCVHTCSRLHRLCGSDLFTFGCGRHCGEHAHSRGVGSRLLGLEIVLFKIGERALRLTVARVVIGTVEAKVEMVDDTVVLNLGVLSVVVVLNTTRGPEVITGTFRGWNGGLNLRWISS